MPSDLADGPVEAVAVEALAVLPRLGQGDVLDALQRFGDRPLRRPEVSVSQQRVPLSSEYRS